MEAYRPEQYGQLVGLETFPLWLIVASHSWSSPFEHFHHTFIFALLVTSYGISVPFFVGCHSLATLGSTYASELSLPTLLPEQYGQPACLRL
nr:hypothetical protein [Bacillus thuringiensis]